MTAVHEAPGDFPGGKAGQVLTVEFTGLGIPCLGLDGGPHFKQSAVVQGPLGPVLADHAARKKIDVAAIEAARRG